MRSVVGAALGIAIIAIAAPTMAFAENKAKVRTALAQAQSATSTAQSPITQRVTAWIAGSKDNGKMPYAVIDKQNAQLFLFDARGRAAGDVPVLIGIGTGDDSSPGVGSKVLARIGPAERTTPSGRFVARFGAAAGGQRVLWVDYGNSVALHAVITTNRKERRLQRLRSPSADDNRITFGCINVPTAFYAHNLRPLFQRKGGLVYILPETRPVEHAFPQMLIQQPMLAAQKQ